MTIDPRDPQDPLHRALRRLPPPRAPRTLLPRVMAAVESQRPIGATRPWFAWPVEWQVGAVAALVIIAASAAWIWPGVEAVAGAFIARGLQALEARAVALAPGTAAMTHLVSVVWETFLQPIVGVVVVWMVVMSAACAACVAALERVAFGEASQ